MRVLQYNRNLLEAFVHRAEDAITDMNCISDQERRGATQPGGRQPLRLQPGPQRQAPGALIFIDAA